MNVLVTLTSAGTDTGPFNLYCNADNYIATLATGISREVALAGYLCTTVPDTASIIRVQSLGKCSNHVDLTISFPATTTTSTTPIPTTTTTTTPVPPPITTTTTTTAYVPPVTTTTTTTSGGGGTTTTTTTAGGGTTTTTTTAATPTTTTTTTIAGTTTTTTTPAPNYLFYFEFVGNSAATYQLNLNNVAGSPTTTTNYNLVQSGNNFYQMGGDSITKIGGGSQTISKIEKIDYDGVTILQTILVGGTSFTWSSYQTTMNSTGVAAGEYQTVRITII